jgi:surface antigen
MEESEPEKAPVAAAADAATTTTAAVASTPAATSPKKKKKKKNGYADLLAGVMAPTLSDTDKEQELESKMKASLGGGQFSKLDRI